MWMDEFWLDIHIAGARQGGDRGEPLRVLALDECVEDIAGFGREFRRAMVVTVGRSMCTGEPSGRELIATHLLSQPVVMVTMLAELATSMS
jgi:hypothetical protein